MPVEGQSRRVNAPLPRRDRLALLATAVVSLLAILGAAVYYATRSSQHANQRCTTTTVPSTMGGAAHTTCTPK